MGMPKYTYFTAIEQRYLIRRMCAVKMHVSLLFVLPFDAGEDISRRMPVFQWLGSRLLTYTHVTFYSIFLVFFIKEDMQKQTCLIIWFNMW